VEVGETVEEAIVREVHEETGIIVKPKKLITVFDSIHRNKNDEPTYHYILFEFICEYVSGQIKASSDASNARWIQLDNLESVDIMQSTKRFIEKVTSGKYSTQDYLI
jgi:8-oxo-dGTP diphosphatase